MIKNITIGSDPEFVITKNGENYPSTMLLDSTKDNPEDFGGGFMILKDNVLVEGNIPPVENKDDFKFNLDYLKDIILLKLDKNEFDLDFVDSAEYKPKYLKHPEAQLFGCAGAYNVYDSIQELKPAQVIKGNKRGVGFHIHVGFESAMEGVDKEVFIPYIVKSLDLHLLTPSLLENFDKFRWNTSYGGFGKYRITNYGLEYRSLGGFFLQEKYIDWVYDQVIKAINFINPNTIDFLDSFVPTIQQDDIENSIYKIISESPVSIKENMFNENVMVNV